MSDTSAVSLPHSVCHPLAAAAALQEREGKDVAKGEAKQLAIDKKRLERQRAELLGALRKQGRLVEVLQRQKAHLEAARALAFTEAEFMRVIELGGAGGGGA
jgi:hypothetical protein